MANIWEKCWNLLDLLVYSSQHLTRECLFKDNGGSFDSHAKSTNKLTYIKTIVLLFLCKYNTEHVELNLFIWNMWQNRNTIHTLMWRSILCLLQIVEGFGTSFESGQSAHPCCLTRLYIVGCFLFIFWSWYPYNFWWIVW